ncbi:hypothetical protein Lal_00030491 [Lupinus albus]|uniref:Uncharacterized protein n=1 Tax=Lupinus albus TaxID=3870 RepID=A0A6A5LRS3_LUPAL|nr:hypothetical protein Lalb_Chr17g0343991 [Lupinus albus]KAF1863459.1 hypothetical protein Lal_00030491 [Lupinus albus]
MERSEPALVPEWLRSAGSVAGSGNSAQHFASSYTNTDPSSEAHHTRNRSSKTNTGFDSSRPLFFERTSSSNSRRSTINGSAKHPYSSFNRNNRDKERDREKDRSNFGVHLGRQSSDPLSTLFSPRKDRDMLMRSHSTVSRNQSEILPRRVTVDTKSGGSGNQNYVNGILSGGNTGSSIQKAVFDMDFPSLGAEEKPEIGRVSSPGLGATASQSLSVGSSALIGGEGWTSALAEVPNIIGSSRTGSHTVQQTITVTPRPVALSMTAGLNMAEALAQAPSRDRSAPKVLVETQRLEELAIKQSRQLIPVTPSMPKALVLNSSEKSKPKTAVRNAEMNLVAKSVLQQQPCALQHIASQSVRSANAKVDAPKTSGRFTDLKSVVWENGGSPTFKDVSNPTNHSNSKPGNQNAVASAIAAASPSRNTNDLKLPDGRKPISMDLKLGSSTDKKHSLSQVKSRNDFFNLIKKKTLTNSSAIVPNSGSKDSSTVEKSGEENSKVVSPSASPRSLRNGAELTSNGKCHAHEEVHRFSDNEDKDSSPCATIYPDEEEAAFLRSLGWEENSDEGEEGLTEEEINAFYQECKKLGPATFHLSSAMQPLSKLIESYASAELSSSDPVSEA